MNTGIMKEFNQLCTKRGFKKSGKVYSRCIGEGVYQNITLEATEYRTISKREPIVGFNFVSMYSNLSPYHFSNRKWEMQFYAENLIGESFTGMYAGLPEEKLPKSYEEEIEIMMGVGLDYLDGIQTSRDVIKRTEELQIIQNGRIRSGNAVLCGPYLMCNEGENAFSIAARVYAKNWDAFHSNYDRLRKEGHYEEYVQKEIEFEEECSENFYFMKIVMYKQIEKIEEFLKMCLKRNIQYAEQYGIPVDENVYTLLNRKIDIQF